MVQRISISLPERVREFIEQRAREQGISRSRLIAELVQAEEARLMEQQLAQGYLAMAEEHARFAEDALEVALEAWGPNEMIALSEPQQEG